MALLDTDMGNNALIRIKERIKNQGLQRRILIPFRCGNIIDNRIENRFNANAGFR